MGFTPAQDAAIHARNRELLVSAAAGSGKTRVLIERIYSLLQEDGLSLDRLLIVTFTHAAAAEMRERLQLRLSQEAATDPRLRKQAELLETAQISTLHSFCQKLVREYFQEVDIDPQAMLGDETVCANLRTQAKTEAMEWLYTQAEAGEPTACSLTAKLEDAQIDRMMDDLYPFLMGLPEPFAWLATQADKLYTPQDLVSGAMADTLLADCQLLLSGAMELAVESQALGEYPTCHEKYLPTIQSDLHAVEALQAAASHGLPGIIAASRGFALERLPTVKGLEGKEGVTRDQYKDNRERIKKVVASIAAHLPEDVDTAIAHLNAMQPALQGLGAVMLQLDERYAALKRERALIDFHDLERMALRILQNPAIREEVAARFDGVFVDEYQDISAVQEAILDAIKRDVSRETFGHPQRYFYVGDVKQSIYRFRQADPSLFMHKAHTFAAAEEATQRRISLNANFRSREAVLAAVNRVFERIMRADVTEIDYDEEARLYPGAPSIGDVPASLHLLTQPVKAADKAKLQAYAIGCEIRRRVGEPVWDAQGAQTGTLRYRDIAILGPKMKSTSGVLERTLGEMGIPVYCEDRGSSLESEEIRQALNHLRLLDNIADDLALLGVLKSPAIGMDERELAAVRLMQPQGSYLEAMRATAQQADVLGKRCRHALDYLAQERFLLTETPLHEYLWGWLNRCGLYAFYGCQSNGKLRQANLRMLCERAGEHVKRRGGDLRDFLNSVEAQAGVRDSASPTVLSPWEDVVRVMTIHKSKGLEFPVVFVMGLDEGFGSRHNSQLAAHPRLGVALPYVNEQARTTGSTLLRAAIDLRQQSEEKAERARLLYVAMTRARDELILMGCGNQLTPEQAADGFAQNERYSAYSVFSANSMLAWVCGCVGKDDAVEVWQQNEVTHDPVRITASQDAFSTLSTYNPQKRGQWRVVFHTGETELATALRYAKGRKERTELESRRARLQALAEDVRLLGNRLRLLPDAQGGHYTDADPNMQEFAGTDATEQQRSQSSMVVEQAAQTGAQPLATIHSSGLADPIAPALPFTHHPFKIGVTAFVRADAQTRAKQPALYDPEEGDPGAVESIDLKRLPLPMTRPRMMADLPDLPAFMRPPAEQTGLRRGVATHKALSLLDLPALSLVTAAKGDLHAEVERQLKQLRSQNRLTAQEAPLTDATTITAFWQSDIGQQALQSAEVHREWGFNLRLPERDGLIVQGVIDLCYLWQNEWVLVDYKTDHVREPGELWSLYGEQIALYRRALSEATGIPVRRATLYALTLCQSAEEPQA